MTGAEPLSVAKVFIPPKFVSPFDEYIRIQEGDSLALECEITGNPIPKVMWTINDKKVENARTEMEVSFFVIKQQLSIVPSTIADYSFYQ